MTSDKPKAQSDVLYAALEQQANRFLSVPERLAKSRQEHKAKAAFAAKLTTAPKRRK